LRTTLPTAKNSTPRSHKTPALDELVSDEVYTSIAELRVRDPTLAARLAAKRRRRRELTDDGRLAILAADHPGRMVTAIRGDSVRMGDRRELLSRIVRVLSGSRFDGVLATADIIDELLIIGHAAGGRASKLLDGRVLIGSMNRGGLAGSAFELDDAETGYDADGLVAMNMDGGKFLLRLDPEDRDSGRTLEYCVRAVRRCGEKGLPIFVEPLPVNSKAGAKLDRDPEKIIRLVGVVSALSSSSARMWLKLPYCEGFDRVVRSTTLPILLLGGEATNDIDELLLEVEAAMRAGPNVRGVLMGRSLLYPPVGDPASIASAVASMVHRGVSARTARREIERRGGSSRSWR